MRRRERLRLFAAQIISRPMEEQNMDNWMENHGADHHRSRRPDSEVLLEAGSEGTMIEDKNDVFANQRPEGQWDIIDEAIAERIGDDVKVTGYYPADANLRDVLARIQSEPGAPARHGAGHGSRQAGNPHRGLRKRGLGGELEEGLQALPPGRAHRRPPRLDAVRPSGPATTGHRDRPRSWPSAPAPTRPPACARR